MRVAILAPILAVRAGLSALLSASELAAAGIEVVWEAAALADLEPALAQADTLLLTGEALATPGLAQALAPYGERLALLLLAERPEDVRLLLDLPVRAWGALPLDSSEDELAAALQALDQGLLVGAPELMRPAMVQRLLAQSGSLGIGGEQDHPVEELTGRESEVLQLLTQGLANKQIAARLGISEHTVKFHVSAIYAKLGATNRAEAVRVGVQRGLVLL